MGNLMTDQLLQYSVLNILFFFSLYQSNEFSADTCCTNFYFSDQLIIFKCYHLFLASSDSSLLFWLLNMEWILQDLTLHFSIWRM